MLFPLFPLNLKCEETSECPWKKSLLRRCFCYLVDAALLKLLLQATSPDWIRPNSWFANSWILFHIFSSNHSLLSISLNSIFLLIFMFQDGLSTMDWFLTRFHNLTFIKKIPYLSYSSNLLGSFRPNNFLANLHLTGLDISSFQTFHSLINGYSLEGRHWVAAIFPSSILFSLRYKSRSEG